MRTVLPVPVGEALPSPAAVLEGQGIPRGRTPDDRTERLVREAISRYEETARPRGVLVEIGREEFRTVFEGEGRNAGESPVGPIAGSADSLALFAVTLGEEICGEIARLFGEQEFALGSMLDSAASEGTEMTARVLEGAYRRHLAGNGRLPAAHGTLRFSPGYCGWHVSAQGALFRALRPAEIGIALNASFLMRPLKSISGVIVAGRKEIFDFDDAFPFCNDCATHECRDRIRSLHEGESP
jgi:hypothetical protein